MKWESMLNGTDSTAGDRLAILCRTSPQIGTTIFIEDLDDTMSQLSTPTLWQQTQTTISSEADENGSQASDLGQTGLAEAEDEETEDDGLTTASTSASQSQSVTNYQVENYKFTERLAHFTPGNVFRAGFEKAVQAAIIFEAGERVQYMLRQQEKILI